MNIKTLSVESESNGNMPPEERKSPSRFTVFVLLALVAALAGVSYYFYNQLNEVKQNPNIFAEQEDNKIIEAVGKLIVLPEGEKATVAKVLDPSGLKDQLFFLQAQKGDQVLIYYQAKKAILYRPSINKIIEVGPVILGDQQGSTPPPPPTEEANP